MRDATDRDLASQPRVARTIDLAHSATANRRVFFVRSDFVPAAKAMDASRCYAIPALPVGASSGPWRRESSGRHEGDIGIEDGPFGFCRSAGWISEADSVEQALESIVTAQRVEPRLSSGPDEPHVVLVHRAFERGERRFVPVKSGCHYGEPVGRNVTLS